MPPTQPRRVTGVAVALCLALAAAVAAVAAPARGEDSAARRAYLSLRADLTPGATKAHDAGGGALGLNLGRYFGVELAVDSYELKAGEVAEIGILGLLPQVRLRYPLLGDRLTPYLVGGIGLAVSQANDARVEVEWPGGKTRVYAMGSIGGGLEYFIADNIAVGMEAKYLLSGQLSYESDIESDDVDLNTGILTLAFRYFYPELHPEEASEAARRARARFYMHVRTGAAWLTGSGFPDLDTKPEQRLFGDFTHTFGVAAGANFGRYAGIEISLDNQELIFELDGEGEVGEYSVFPIAVQPRLRYPLLGGRLEPYIFSGIGAEFAEYNDATYAQSSSLSIHAKDVTLIGTFGGGLEWYLTSNLALGLESRYVISRDHQLEMNSGPEMDGNLDSWFLSFGVRAFLFQL